MFKDKLNETGTLALDFLTRCLAAAWEVAWRHRRMTAKGVAAAVAILAARRGLELTADQVTYLALGISVFLGVAGRDKQQRRTL